VDVYKVVEGRTGKESMWSRGEERGMME
jgi:hypothetical protein